MNIFPLAIFGLCLLGHTATNADSPPSWLKEDGDGLFNCSSIPEKLIPQSHVLDGICDCCNGLDEARDLNSNVKDHLAADLSNPCPDTCEQERGSLAKSLQTIGELHSEGVKAAIRWKRRHKPDRASRSQLKEAYLEFRRYADYMQQQYKSLASRQTSLHAQQVAGELQRLQPILQSLKARADGQLGPKDSLLHLMDHCISSTSVSEKLSKGGSRTSFAKSYTYRVCFGANVTQAESLPDEWMRLDKASRGETEMMLDSTGSTSVPNRSAGSPTLLGYWMGYLDVEDVDAHIWSGSPSFADGGVISRSGPAVATRLTTGQHFSTVAMLYSVPDVCRTEEVVVPVRRTYVMHVCPGIAAEVYHAPLANYLPSPMGPRARQHDWNAAYDAVSQSPFGRVVHVEEDGLCTYKIYVESIFACSETLAANASLWAEKLIS